MQLRGSSRARPSSPRHLPGRPVPGTWPETPDCLRPHPGQQLPVEGGAHVDRTTSHPREGTGGRPTPQGRKPARQGPGPLLTSELLSPCPGCPWPRPALRRPPHLAPRDGLGGARRIAATAAAAACRAPPPPAAHPPLSQPQSPPEAHPQAQSFCERALSPSRARALPRPHQPPDTRRCYRCRKCVALSGCSPEPAPIPRGRPAAQPAAPGARVKSEGEPRGWGSSGGTAEEARARGQRLRAAARGGEGPAPAFQSGLAGDPGPPRGPPCTCRSAAAGGARN